MRLLSLCWEKSNSKTMFRRGAPQGGLSCPCGAIRLLYLAEHTLQTASVEFAPIGGQIMRAADCKNLSESPEGVFDSLKDGRRFNGVRPDFVTGYLQILHF